MLHTQGSVVSRILSVQLLVFHMAMGCTFAVPSLWTFRGLTRSYTCTHPAESITYPHVTSILADADFFSITCLDEADNSCTMQSHWVFWESLGVIFLFVKSHIPGYGNVLTSEQGGQLGFVLLSDGDTGTVVRLSEG